MPHINRPYALRKFRFYLSIMLCKHLFPSAGSRYIVLFLASFILTQWLQANTRFSHTGDVEHFSATTIDVSSPRYAQHGIEDQSLQQSVILHRGKISRPDKKPPLDSLKPQGYSIKASSIYSYKDTLRRYGFAEHYSNEIALLLRHFKYDSGEELLSKRFEFLLGGDHPSNPQTQMIAVHFRIGNTSHWAYRFQRDNGEYHYIDQHGLQILPSFLPHPIDLKRARISSTFANMRWHPITGRRQPHRGVDYAARIGTAVYSAADGEIAYSGAKGNFGRVVEIKHRGGYRTIYAHLSLFARGVREGRKVRLGQIIGYVGKSGQTTGPHLHYELHIDNKPVDPLTIRLPSQTPLTASELGYLKRHAMEPTAYLQARHQKYAANSN